MSERKHGGGLCEAGPQMMATRWGTHGSDVTAGFSMTTAVSLFVLLFFILYKNTSACYTSY